MNGTSQGGASGIAIGAVVLGVLALLSSPLVLGLPLGLAGLILAVAHARQRTVRTGLLAWAVGLSLAGMAGSMAAASFYLRAYRDIRAEFASGDADEPPKKSTRHADWVGMQTPAMTLTTLDGQTVDVRSLAGRPVVLNFWATWCGPCRQELPHLAQLARDEPGVTVLGISDESQATLEAFDRRQPIGFGVASMPSPPRPFDGVRSLPTTVFIDRNGVVREVRVGYLDFEMLRRQALAADFSGTVRPSQ